MPEEEKTDTALSVTYTNSRRDLVWFNILMMFRSRPNQILLGLLLLLDGFAAIMESGPWFWSILIFAVSVVFTLAMVAALTALAVALGVSARRNRAVLTQHTVTLTPKGVIETTIFNHNEIYWHGVDRIVDAGGFVCVHPGQFSAYIIPGSAFQTDQKRREFVKYAADQIRLSRSTPPAL